MKSFTLLCFLLLATAYISAARAEEEVNEVEVQKTEEQPDEQMEEAGEYKEAMNDEEAINDEEGGNDEMESDEKEVEEDEKDKRGRLVGTDSVPNGIYLIENDETKRYLFQTGTKFNGIRGQERGWRSSPKCVGSDANYYNRAYWKIINKRNGRYFIENVETRRLLFSTGTRFFGRRGKEGGWLNSPKCVGSDANYYNRAFWKITSQGNGRYFIENANTRRLLFSTGAKFTGNRGQEGGWLKSPIIVGSDANYYNRAYWKLVKLR